MKKAKNSFRINHDNMIVLLGVSEKPASLMMELCELYIEPFNADKKSVHWISFCRI